MITIQTADKALKEVYLGVVSNELNICSSPFYAQVEQTTNDVWGNTIKKVAPYGINGGICAGLEAGNLPVAGGNTYKTLTLDLKNLYGKLEISDKAMRVSMNSSSAFVNLLNAEMEGLIKSSAFNLARMLHGDGTGNLCKVTDNGTGSLTVDSTKNLMVGMLIDVGNDSDYVFANTVPLKIADINRATNVVTVTGQTFTASELKVTQSQTTQYYVYIQNSCLCELSGLGYIFDSISPLYGNIRMNNKWVIPYEKDITSNNATTDINDIKIQTTLDDLSELGASDVDFIICSNGVKRNYQNYFSSYRTNVDYLELNGGFKAISYSGIPIYGDKFAKANSMYLLNSKDFHLHQLCDWKWLEGEGGGILKQSATSPTYSATLVKYCDLMCDRPFLQARIKGISES